MDKVMNIALCCCNPNSQEVHSWLSGLGSATCGQQSVYSPFMLQRIEEDMAMGRKSDTYPQL